MSFEIYYDSIYRFSIWDFVNTVLGRYELYKNTRIPNTLNLQYEFMGNLEIVLRHRKAMYKMFLLLLLYAAYIQQAQKNIFTTNSNFLLFCTMIGTCLTLRIEQNTEHIFLFVASSIEYKCTTDYGVYLYLIIQWYRIHECCKSNTHLYLWISGLCKYVPKTYTTT